MERAIDACIDDVREILAREGPSEQGMGQLVERMEVLTIHMAILNAIAANTEAPGRHTATGLQAQIVHTGDSGLSLIRARFDPAEATTVHSHSAWGDPRCPRRP